MAAQSGVTSSGAHSEAVAAPGVAAEGALAGFVGAATIALWFLLLDTLNGHPLYTPTVLGTALFRGHEALSAPGSLPIDFELVIVFTWVHILHFIIIGAAASVLLSMAERNPNVGFGILLLFVIFEFGFVVACMLFAEPVSHALAWPAVLVGNLLAAAAIGITLWRRHPTLKIAP